MRRLALAALVLLSCGRHVTAAAGDRVEHLSSGGRDRTYLLHLPSSAETGRLLPAVIALHGHGGTGVSQEKLGDLTTLADREGFIAAYPDGIDKSWADARGTTPASTQNVDDLAFLSALIDTLVSQHGADPKRIYVTGMSNGGMMTNTVGCSLSEKVAAIAPVAGLMPKALETTCAPKHPLSALIVHGTKDGFVPYEGGELKKGSGGEVLSAKGTLEAWAKLARCTASDGPTALPDTADDGTTATLEKRTGCEAGAEVQLLTIENGGHTWPGGWQYLGEWLIGKTSRDVNASERIWQFFAAHPLP